MRKAIATFLTVLLLLQCSMKVGIVAYYQVNKAYIASSLCENKAKPSMNCQGKCFLAKKLKAQDNQSKGMTDLLKLVVEIAFCFPETVFDLNQPSSVSINKTQNGFYLIKPYTSQLASLFQPPRI